MATIEVTYTADLTDKRAEMTEDEFYEWIDANLIQAGLDIGLGVSADLYYEPVIDPDNYRVEFHVE
jgi:hypothetical protein